MKKHRTARLLSVILAVVMIFGSISVGVTAAYAPYLDDALTDNYNTIDQVTLTEAQQASLLLDKVDRALADANIVIDVSVVGTLNLTSIDNALSSIYSVTGNILFSSATVCGWHSCHLQGWHHGGQCLGETRHRCFRHC